MRSGEVIGLAFAERELISYVFLFSKTSTRNDEYVSFRRSYSLCSSYRARHGPRRSRPDVADAAFLRADRGWFLFPLYRPPAQKAEGTRENVE
jgi:hypothetical protein